MKERPINFKAWEAQAIRAGRKTQFRRVVKNTGLYAIDSAIHGPEVAARELIALASRCPYGAPGDRLWVRETWQFCDYDGPGGDPKTDVVFRADGETDDKRRGWKSPVHMPRWASRITLELVSVRVERLQDISEGDAKKEGVQRGAVCDDAQCDDDFGPMNFVDGYQIAWESTNGPGSWGENPFVWVVEFRRV